MAKRQKAWARKWRDRILVILGGRCQQCRTRKDLQFDVIIPCDSTHHRKMDWSWRMSFYRRQLAAGNLQLLCSKHNAQKGGEPPDPF